MIKAFKAIASNTDFLTSQSFLFERLEGEGGKLILSLLISASGEDIFNRARQVGLLTQDVFFDSPADIPGKIAESLDYILEQLKQDQNLEVLVAVFSENALYIQSIGEGRAYLLRDGKLMHLPVSSQILSGFLQENDKLLLLSCFKEEEVLDKQKLIFSDDFAEELLSKGKEELEETLEDLVKEERINIPLSVAVLDLTPEDYGQETVSLPKVRNNPFEKITSIKLKKINFNFLLNFFRKVWRLNLKVKIISLLIFLIIISVGVFALLGISRDIASSKQSDVVLAGANEKLNKAKSLSSEEKAQAKQLLDQSKSEVEAVLSKDPNNLKAQQLKSQIEQSSPDILHIYKVDDSSWQVFLSLDLIKPGFSSDKLSFSVGEFLLLDTSQISLVALSLEGKTNKILAGRTDLGEATSFSLNGDNAFSYSKDKGVVRTNIYSKKTVVAAQPDPSWGNIKDIYAFAGNFYLLDTVNSQIWKYVPIEGGYSDRQAYLSKESDFIGALKIQIDGSIWVLNSDSQILKFTSGEKDFFSPSNLDQNLSKVVNFFVSSDTEYIYLLDQGNSRLVVLEKDGKYHSQYIGGKFATASDLVVDEENKKIYLLEGNKIYLIDLR